MASYDKADLQRRMHGAVESLKHDLGGLRTGRASTTLLDPIQVEVYGAHMPLNQVATVMNALALQNALEKAGVDTRVQSAIPMATVSEPYIRRRAVRHMEKGRVVIFAAGTGNPFFTTDTAAALRAAEMGCDALFKGTSVDGVYTADPKKVSTAKRYEQLSFHRVLSDDLRVMDASAVALCRDNNIPIVVFNIREQGNLAKVLSGEGTATIVRNDQD